MINIIKKCCISLALVGALFGMTACTGYVSVGSYPGYYYYPHHHYHYYHHYYRNGPQHVYHKHVYKTNVKTTNDQKTPTK